MEDSPYAASVGVSSRPEAAFSRGSIVVENCVFRLQRMGPVGYLTSIAASLQLASLGEGGSD
jgi:hypothetical protein